MRHLLWCFLVLYYAPTLAQVTISEVMFDPVGDENTDEWIELYNTSSDSISLQQWTLKVDGVIDSLRIFPGDSTSSDTWVIPPQEFVLIHDSDYPVGEQSFESIIPDTVRRFVIADSRFGQYGLSNSSGRMLQLVDTAGTVISQYQYSPDNSEGYTDEKIDLTGNNNAQNWGNSSTLNGTPGFRNSISPRDYDLTVLGTPTWNPDPALSDSGLIVTISIRNIGLFSASNATLVIGTDVNGDSILQLSEEISSQSIPQLEAGQATNAQTRITLSGGINRLIARIDFPDDEDTNNNSILWEIPVGFPSNTLIINEIMYDPNDEPEWVEIYNRSAGIIDLSRWTVTDASGNTGTIEPNSVAILPDSFAVITADPSLENDYPELNPNLMAIVDELPTLNNSNDAIVLRSPAGEVQDSVRYYSDWGGQNGESLERINPDHESNSADNWATSESENGATPGYTNSVAVKEIDFALQRLQIIADGSDRSIQAVVRNVGRTPQSDWSLNLYHDNNENQIVESTELLGTEVGDILNPGDSTIIDIPLQTSFYGYHRFEVNVILNADQAPENDSLWVDKYFGYPANTVEINEIMYYPETGEPEWVELYVARDSVDLRHWIFRDNGHQGQIPFGQKRLFSAGDFVILAPDQSVLQSYPDLNFPVVTVSGFPTLNNGLDSVRIADATSNLQDELQYSSEMGGDLNVSLERKNLAQPATEPDNWGSSVAEIGATPGAVNSIAILDHDVVLKPESITSLPTFPEPGQSWTLTFTVKNAGLDPVSAIEIQLFEDENHNVVFEPNELIYQTQRTLSLSAGDSAEVELSPPQIKSGIHNFQLTVSITSEMRPENNSAIFTVKSPFTHRSLLVTEFAPIPGESWSEFVEIYNPGADTISLKNWHLADNMSSAWITNNSVSVFPQQYAILAQDSSIYREFSPPTDVPYCVVQNWRSLNNSGDAIILRDPTNRVIDSLRYDSDWQIQPGISKERRWYFDSDNPIQSWQPENWLDCRSENGATPGTINSVAVPEIDLALKSLQIVGNVNFSLQTIVQNTGRTPQSNWSLNLYHDVNEDQEVQSNELIRTETGNALTPGDSTVINIPLPKSVHGFQQFEATLVLEGDQFPLNDSLWTNTYFGYPDSTVEINEIMYHPETGEPEWIEIYVARDSVDLRHWSLRDAGHQGQVDASQKHLYNTGDYVVLAPDESVKQSYPELDFPVMTVPDFPTLNNGSDSVRIADATANMQDELRYTSEMGGDNGISLERINLADSADTENNWGSSVSSFGATPGAINSIALLENDLALDAKSIGIDPEFPKPNQSWTLTFKIKNTGLKPISSVEVTLIEDKDKNAIFDQSELFYQINKSLNLSSTDSTEITLSLPGLTSGSHDFKITVSMGNEMRPADNSATFKVNISFPKQSLLLTEFAPIPGEGWSEFVEIYNPGSDTISLENWHLGDNSASAIITSHSINLLPNQYAVLAPDSSVAREFSPPENIAYCVIPNWRSLNNSGDAIVLQDPTGRAIDSLSYTSDWDILPGISKERRWYLNNDSLLQTTSLANWFNSTAAKGATPGRLNSQAVTAREAVTVSIDSLAKSASPGSNITGSVTVRNAGLDSINRLQLSVGFDVNMDSMLDNDESQFSKELHSLAPSDTQRVEFSILSPITPGWNPLIIEVQSDSAHSALLQPMWIPYARQSILLNEILPDPSQIFPSEFIELVNITEQDINLANWKLKVNDRSILVPDSVTIHPNEYLVFDEDSLRNAGMEITQFSPGDWSTFPNSNGTVELFDLYGFLMDSLTYSAVEKGRSLERIHLQKEVNSLANWRSSVAKDGATPGKPNSFYVNPDSIASGWTVSPSPFSPDDDGYDDILKIVYNGKSALDYVTIKVYDSVGRLIKTLVRDEPAPAQYTWFWDGRDNRDRIAPIDIYLIQIRYKSPNHSKHQKLFTAILAKKL